MRSIALLLASALAPLAHARPANSTALDETPPQIPPTCRVGNPYTQTIKDGDGNPHQNFIFKQISGVTDCTNNPGGSAAISSGLDVGWSISAGFAGGFITGGYSVTETVSTTKSNTFGCKTNTGTHTGGLCVFERIQVTAFTAKAQTCVYNSCRGTSCGAYSAPGVIFAPNSIQGNCYYDNFQLGLPCGLLGSEQHINAGPAGGPQFIACNPSMA